ncbi:uncharacterized protein [Branchiostoma lanceolatum]|uniref:uncharacterized protein isoform X2 n=1 Tax=Branchiostoma lanceolatum TaxID=7740 RepID=UPI0034562238
MTKPKTCTVCQLPVRGHRGPHGRGKCGVDLSSTADTDSDRRLLEDRVRRSLRKLKGDSKVKDYAKGLWSEVSASDEERPPTVKDLREKEALASNVDKTLEEIFGQKSTGFSRKPSRRDTTLRSPSHAQDTNRQLRSPSRSRDADRFRRENGSLSPYRARSPDVDRSRVRQDHPRKENRRRHGRHRSSRSTSSGSSVQPRHATKARTRKHDLSSSDDVPPRRRHGSRRDNVRPKSRRHRHRYSSDDSGSSSSRSPRRSRRARRDPRRSRDAQKALRRPRDNGLLDADLRHPRDMDNQRDLRRLRGQASRTKWAAFADGTWSNLRTILRTYLLFCTFYCLTPFPASVDTLEPFAEMLARSFRAPASIANYLGGLRSLHVLFGWTVDAFLSPDIALMKRGLQRRLCHTPRQVAPFTPDILLRILEHLDMTDPFHATIWTLLILSFFTFQRKSNFLPKGRFDPAKQCTIHDFQIFPNYMLVRIRWSKTIQCAERVLYLPVLAIPESPLCPVAAFRHMLKLNPYDGLAVFTVRYSKRVLPMSQAVFDNAFKRVLVQAGLNPQSYSLHSGRRGGATFAFRSGVPVELIKIQGDWRSNAYLLYLKVPLRKRLELCDMMVKRLRTPCSVLHYD